MQHGGELNTQLPRRMDGDAGLHGLAHRSCLYARAETAPEGGVEENDIDCRIAHVRRQLLEVNHHRVGGEPDWHSCAHLPHTVQSPCRILVIVVGEVSDCLAEPDRLFHGEEPRLGRKRKVSPGSASDSAR